jgi:hypothetical protein
VVDEWPACFLGTVHPSILSTALTGDVTVELRLAPNSVLINVGVKGNAVPGDGADWAGEGRPHFDGQESELYWAPATAIGAGQRSPATNARYVLNGVHMSVKTIDISDGGFYDWLKAEVPMSLPFQHIVSQPGQTCAPGSVDQTMTMTVNSGSVDMVLGTFYGTDYQEGTLYPKGAWAITDPVQKPIEYGAMPYTYRHKGSFGNAQTSRYFQRGSVYSRVDKPFESSFSVNNVQMDYPADLATVFARAKDDFNLGRTGETNINPRICSLPHFAQAYFVATQKLNFNTGAADDSRILSGLDSRNATVHVQWKTSGATENDVNNAPIQVFPMLYASTTARLNIGAGRVLDLVY